MELEHALETQDLARRRYVRNDGTAIGATYRSKVASRHAHRRRPRHRRPARFTVTSVRDIVEREVHKRWNEFRWTHAFFAACTVAGIVMVVFGLVEMAQGKGATARWDLLAGLFFWTVPAIVFGILWARPSRTGRRSR